MSEEEAEVVADIISTADGGCIVCVRSLAIQMKERFPQFDWYSMCDVKETEEE